MSPSRRIPMNLAIYKQSHLPVLGRRKCTIKTQKCFVLIVQEGDDNIETSVHMSMASAKDCLEKLIIDLYDGDRTMFEAVIRVRVLYS